jgi:hypothetical protein
VRSESPFSCGPDGQHPRSNACGRPIRIALCPTFVSEACARRPHCSSSAALATLPPSPNSASPAASVRPRILSRTNARQPHSQPAAPPGRSIRPSSVWGTAPSHCTERTPPLPRPRNAKRRCRPSSEKRFAFPGLRFTPIALYPKPKASRRRHPPSPPAPPQTPARAAVAYRPPRGPRRLPTTPAAHATSIEPCTQPPGNSFFLFSHPLWPPIASSCGRYAQGKPSVPRVPLPQQLPMGDLRLWMGRKQKRSFQCLVGCYSSFSIWFAT